MLRERAAIGYTGDVFHRLDDTSPYQKMLAALWRESPVTGSSRGSSWPRWPPCSTATPTAARTSPRLVRRSGLAPLEWVQTYLRAHLRPLVHCLLRHDLAFMPHGENLIMVLRDGVPVRMLMKDIGEEVAVLATQPLPAAAERIRHELPREQLPLPILTDVFDGFLRHLAAILDEDGLLAEATFWASFAGCIEEHAADHPELAEAAKRYDLLRPRVPAQLPEPAAAAQHPGDGRPRGPVESMVHAGATGRVNPAARRVLVGADQSVDVRPSRVVVGVVEPGQPGGEALDRGLELRVHVGELLQPLGDPGQGDLLVTPPLLRAPRCRGR